MFIAIIVMEMTEFFATDSDLSGQLIRFHPANGSDLSGRQDGLLFCMKYNSTEL